MPLSQIAALSLAGSRPRSTMEDRGIGVGDKVRPISVVLCVCNKEGGVDAMLDAFIDEDDDGVEISAAVGDWGIWDGDLFDEQVDEQIDCP